MNSQFCQSRVHALTDRTESLRRTLGGGAYPSPGRKGVLTLNAEELRRAREGGEAGRGNGMCQGPEVSRNFKRVNVARERRTCRNDQG